MSGTRERDKDQKPRKSRFDDPKDEGKKQSPDEKLDPMSPNFQPLKALYSSRSVLPDPKAPVYDNLGKYVSVMEGRAASATRSKKTKRVEYDDLPPRDLTDTYDNVMKWMREIDGPMKAIRVCMEKKAKVKVITRDAAGVRGHVIGYVTAFDKLWNLAVEEATEVWTRKRNKKILPTSGTSRAIPKDTHPQRMTAPLINVTQLSKKLEKCERKVDKLLLRGEHIVLISIIDY